VTADLATVIGDVRGRIARHQKAGIGEQDTKAALIAPVLRALGWDLENLEDVKLEYRRRSIDNPVDYALFLLRTPRLFIEAKSLGSRLDDGKWAAQVLSYATAAGVVWVALTDGDQWRIYNSHAAVPVEQKLFRVIRVSDPDAPVIETLGLLARSQMEDRLIDQLWATETVDRQVAKVLKRLFRPEPSPALVEVIRGEASALSDDDVRASLGRVVTTFDFPSISAPVGDAPHPAPPVARPRAAPTVPTVKPPTTDQPLSLASLIETGAITPPLIIEHRFHDRPPSRGRGGWCSMASRSTPCPRRPASHAGPSPVPIQRHVRRPPTAGPSGDTVSRTARAVTSMRCDVALVPDGTRSDGRRSSVR
jgi:hypothetical protein